MSSDAIKHSFAFRQRRFINWFPMGLTYAFLYMGRYNLTVAKNALGELMNKEDFGIIFGIGTTVYAFSFLLNGPLVDKIGGRKGILISAAGSALMNLGMGLYLAWVLSAGTVTGSDIRLVFSLLYAGNMYFQSYGAVSIVKVNAHWFHVRERGAFSGIFGTMISSGIFLAFTVNGWILDAAAAAAGTSEAAAAKWVFFAPAGLLLLLLLIESFLLRDSPSKAGFDDFDTMDASSGDEGKTIPVIQIMKRVVTNPIILTVALIEFCTGVLRNGIMHWFPIYAKEVWVLPGEHVLRRGSWGNLLVIAGFFVVAALFFAAGYRSKSRRKGWLIVSGALVFLVPFLQGGWGGILFVAGVIGANVAGWVSDLVFQSRRAPVAGILYGLLAAASIGMFFTLGTAHNKVGWAGSSAAPLQAGDEIIGLAGTPGKLKAGLNNGEFTTWDEVSFAVSAIPAICLGDAKWNPEKRMCTYDGTGIPEGEEPSSGVLYARIRRGGEELDMELVDPAPEMRAGDKRTLAAGPVLSLNPLMLGLIVFFMSIAVIGTHGLLSGTATMDFGGRKGAATAVGMIDGFVYLGTGVQSFALGYLTTRDWSLWPAFMLPFGIIGFLLLLKIWHAIPTGKKKGAGE